MILADKVIKLRKQRGWSQEELANQLNVSRQAVSKWESASSIPDIDKILKMSQIFEVTTDYLLKEELEEEINVSVPAETEEADGLRTVSMEEALDFMKEKIQSAKKTALAIMAIIISPILLLTLGVISEQKNSPITEDAAGGFGVVVLLLIIACASAVLILVGMKMEKYEYMEKESFHTQYGIEGIARKRKEEFEHTYRVCIVVGVMLCITCVIPLFIAAALRASDLVLILCVDAILIIVSCAVFLFVWASEQYEAFQILLQEGEFTAEKKQQKRSINLIAGVYWCIVTAIYLAVSFYQNSWGRTWVIWPCAGVLFAAICSVVNIVMHGKQK